MMMKGLGLVEESMSNLTSTLSGETSISSNTRNESSSTATNTTMLGSQAPLSQPPLTKRKRSLPGNPDPDAEVIALSPKSLLATNRFLCEICNKGFQRDQNLQLHRRGHNLPWKLKQRAKDQIIRKKVYVCPVASCVHHDPVRALGDLTGIKKHYCRKHGEKKWKCDKCSKKYAVQSDWKAHSKICGTREYRCDCGTLFSRRDSFITHRAFCDALAQESARSINPLTLPSLPQGGESSNALAHLNLPPHLSNLPLALQTLPLKREHDQHLGFSTRPEIPPWLACSPPPPPPPPSQQVALHHRHHPQQVGSGPPSQMDGSHMFSYQQCDHHLNHHHQHDPNPRLDHGFQASPLPQMSATALLQNAAEMGVAVSNHKRQEDHHQHQHHHHHQHQPVSPHGVMTSNKPQPHTHMSTTLSSSCEGDHKILTNTGFIEGQSVSAGAQSSMLHDMMILSSLQSTPPTGGGFEGPGFGNLHPHHHQGTVLSKLSPSHGGGKGGGGGDGMTRDFLGLRTFFHEEFFDMAGLGHMSSPPASFEQHDQQNQTPW